jgi:dTDP-4-amino-4,6-dideoxygalactose transaminase
MKLAVLGGKKVIAHPLFYPWPNVTKEETSALVKKFQTIGFNNYKLDSDIKDFEKQFAKYTGTKYCFTLNSGTAAIFSALIACNLKPADNVIVPAYSFFSAATAVKNAGAKIKFCDVDINTFNVDPKSFQEQIDKNTRAIIVVHMFGNPCDMDNINKIAKKNNIIVIEDACQAHGSVYRNKKVGNLGDIAAFSFHISKNLPVMEGGAVVTNNVSLRDRAASTGLFPNYLDQNHTVMGHNFKFNGLFAKIARLRLKKLDFYNRKKQENISYLTKKIRKYEYIIPQKKTKDSIPFNSMFVFRLDKEKLCWPGSLEDLRNRFLLALNCEGVNCGVWANRTVPEMGFFDIKNKNFPNSEKIAKSTIYVSGLHYPNSKKQVDQIAKAFEKIDENIDELAKIK